MLALWFMFLAMLNSVANAQSNALVAALMIFAWSAHEREKPDAPALLIVLATFIKLFGIFALLPCLLRKPPPKLTSLHRRLGRRVHLSAPLRSDLQRARPALPQLVRDARQPLTKPA